MQIINQIGHLQHWGLSPATNFLSHFPEKQPQTVRVLLTGTCDIRHILKTLTDIDMMGHPQPVKLQVYFHQIHKQLLCRALLFLHIIHEVHLNFQERVQLFLDLYGNSLIKQRNSRYVSNLRLDLLNFIHNEKKVQTPIKNFVKLTMLKFQERDQMSEIMQAWSNKIQFDIVKLRDQRLRYMFKQRYDYRANLIDWDYNMLLTEYAPIIHFYHYKQWRLSGLAFEQRFSTYTQPNRTLASYVPGRKKQQKTSCLVRGYWGDMIISPYIAMGIDTNSSQKQLLFKKANTKYIGHSVQLSQYNLAYWLQRIQTQTTYTRYFRDYYRTDQQGKKKLQQKQQVKKKKKLENIKNTKQLPQVRQQQEVQEQKQQQASKKDKEQQKIKKQSEETESQDKKQKSELQIKQKEPILQAKKEEQGQQLDSQQQQRRDRVRKINKEDIKQATETENKKLKLFEKYGVEIYPMGMPAQNLMKPKFKQFFDVIVCGFIHSAYLGKDRYLQSCVKKGGIIHVQTARYIVPKKKEERKQLHQKLKALVQQKPSKQGQNIVQLELLEDGQDHIIYRRVN